MKKSLLLVTCLASMMLSMLSVTLYADKGVTKNSVSRTILGLAQSAGSLTCLASALGIGYNMHIRAWNERYINYLFFRNDSHHLDELKAYIPLLYATMAGLIYLSGDLGIKAVRNLGLMKQKTRQKKSLDDENDDLTLYER